MNMICKASCSDWFTAGRVYPAAMENPTFMISAILGDDMVSDLTVTGSHWIVPIDGYKTLSFTICGVASFIPWLIPVRFKGLEIADNIRTAAASGRLFLRKSSQHIAIRMFNDKFINDLGREMTMSEMCWHNYKGRLSWWW